MYDVVSILLIGAVVLAFLAFAVYCWHSFIKQLKDKRKTK